MATKDLGLVTAYGYALEGGYTGTEDDFKYLLANLPSKQELLATFKRKTLSGPIVTFTDGADGVPVQALAAQIEPMQRGSGDPSPTNVRPITGWTNVDVHVIGFNQWDEEWEDGYYDSATGRKVASNTQIRSKNPIPVLPNTEYCITKPVSTFRIVEFDETGVFIRAFNTETNIETFTTSANCRYIAFNSFTSPYYGTTYNNDISINYPSIDTEYHPYTGHTTTVPLGQTVYGGTLDVVTGVLTIDHAIVDLGTVTAWLYNSTYKVFTTGRNTTISANFVNDMPAISNVGIDGLVCENYKPYFTGYTVLPTDIPNLSIVANLLRWSSANKTLIIKDERFTDSAQFIQAMQGVHLVYPLATPQTYQLTAQEVKTLLGLNNMWADTGDIDVTYRVDPTLGV